jgi:hypothetical protein
VNENGDPCVPLAAGLLVMPGKAVPAMVMSSGFVAVAFDKESRSPTHPIEKNRPPTTRKKISSKSHQKIIMCGFHLG